MRTTVETLSEVELKLDVEIPADDVSREYQTQVNQTRSRARVKGFRQGKAPRDMIRRIYGHQLAADTAVKLIEGTVDDALKTVTRKVVSQPHVEPAVAEDGQPLRYSVRLQVKPEITIEDWKGLQVAVAPAVLDPAGIDGEIARLRDAHKERVPVEGRGADTGDVIVVSSTGSVAGEPDERLTTEGMEVRMGSGQFIPGFEDQLMGAEVGQTRAVETAFPDDYGHEQLAGKAASFQVEVSGLFVEELPELDDDFAQDVGEDSMEALRESIRSRLQAEAEEERSRDVDDGVVTELLVRQPVEAPPAMVQAQMEHGARRLLSMLVMQGVGYEAALKMAHSNRDKLAEEAGLAVQRFLLLESLAAAEGLVVDDDALEAEIAARAEKDEHAAKHYERAEAREGLRLELVERATLDLLVEHATLTDAVPDEAPETDSPAPLADDDEVPA